MGSLKQFEGIARFDDIMTAVDADGGAIVREFISPELLQKLNEELDADIAATRAGADSGNDFLAAFWGAQTKRFTRLAARAPAFAELLDHELMHQWAQRQFASDYWLNTGQAMIVGPGEKAQVLHRDIVIWPPIQQLGRDGPPVLVSILLALSDFTQEVGATRVVPGSHRWEDFSDIPADVATVSAVMPAGSALLYLGKTVHGAGANTTSAWRRGLHMSFVVGWLTPEEASPVGVPWEVARNYSPRVQRMLGYASSASFGGGSPTNWLIDFTDARDYLAARDGGAALP